MFEGSQIRSVIFDLDGTLVETEHLKARAYAELVGEITGARSPVPEAVELYRSIVGATDLVVCEAMLETFDFGQQLVLNPGESPVDALHRMRMAIYRAKYGTVENLSNAVYEHNIQLLRTASAEDLAIGVATMSFADEAHRVIEAIGLSDMVDTVVGVDDVSRPKPAPDAFLLAMDRLATGSSEALIVEDSPRGARAAAASCARWLCVATEFSSDALRTEAQLDSEWIVWNPSELFEFVARRIIN